MKKVFFNLIVIACFFLIMLSGFFDKTEATTITFDLNYTFSGTSPSSDSPWLIATFTDTPEGVLMTLQCSLESSTEFVGQNGWYFNFDDALDVEALTFTQQSGVAASSINTGEDDIKADGDGYYDINLTWDANTLNNNDTVTYLITSTELIDALSFDFMSEPGGGAGTYYSAAHVQGITGGDGSGWIGSTVTSVPEPKTFILLGIGLLGLGIYGLCGRRKSRTEKRRK